MLETQGQNILSFLQTNPIIAIILGAVLLLLFYARPKEMFKLLGFCLFMVVVFYFILLLAGTVTTGSQSKREGIDKSEKLN